MRMYSKSERDEKIRIAAILIYTMTIIAVLVGSVEFFQWAGIFTKYIYSVIGGLIIMCVYVYKVTRVVEYVFEKYDN